ncbi:MAG: Gfo/Idh/MocA family oxidoreductase [Acidobacteria bacterium]|nr:Gfo/Idh/MocA family oxidoreductase [Acidobacteriota bacterium]
MASPPVSASPVVGLPVHVRRVLVAGMGSSGQRHLRLLNELGVPELVVHTRRPEAARDLTSATVADSFDAALQFQPDLVMVCTTADAKVPLAIAAARAGCHLFIDKPLSNRIDGVSTLQSIVEHQRLTVVAGFDLRFDPGLCRARAWIDEGRIGRVLSIQAQVGQYLPDWRPNRNYRDTASAREAWGGGAIFELTHELDYVTWLAGPVVDVACLSGRVSNLHIDVEDLACMALRFASGAIGTVHVDFLQRVPTRSCRVIGEHGSIEWDYRASEARLQLPDASQSERFSYQGFSRADRFEQQTRHLLACVAGSDTPRADLTTAVDNLRLALAARQSAATGRVTHP